MADYKPDPRGMKALAKSDDMSRAMQQVAEVGKQWAEGQAPRDSGEYAGSFRVAPTTVRGGRRAEDRAGARLANDAPHAAAVEARTGILARSVNIMEGYR